MGGALFGKSLHPSNLPPIAVHWSREAETRNQTPLPDSSGRLVRFWSMQSKKDLRSRANIFLVGKRQEIRPTGPRSGELSTSLVSTR